MHKKDLAKFFSGVAVTEVVGHALFAASNVLPLQFFGFTVSSTYNLVILIMWSIAAIFFIHYAWFKK